MILGNRGRRSPFPLVKVPLRRTLLLSLAAQLVAVPIAAQAIRLDDLGSASFGRREGIPSGPILGLMYGSDRSLWMATQRGVRRYSGSGWTIDNVPGEVTTGLTRSLVEGAGGTRYFVRHTDLLHYRGDSLLQRVDLPDGASPNYSATLTGALGTVPVLVIGGRDGVYRVSGSKVERVAIPNGFNAAAAMVTSTGVAAGSDALWIASSGGVARLRDGEWKTWGAAEGLASFVDHVVPGLKGDSIEALAMTLTGGMALVRGQWRPFGPTTSASRVLRTATPRGIVTWIGLQSGEIIRSQDGVRWDTVAVQGRPQGARVQVLLAVSNGLIEPTIYVGFRNGLLARFRTGSAGKLRGRVIGSLVAIAGGSHSDTVWFSRLGVGPQPLPGFPGPSLPPGMRTTGTAFTMFAPPAGVRTALFAGDGRNIHRLRDGRWDAGYQLPQGDSIRAFVIGATPDGRMAPIAISTTGALIESPDGRLTQWPGFPDDNRLAVSDSADGGTEILLISHEGKVHRVRGATITDVPTADAPLASDIASIEPFRHPSGERTLWVATATGVVIVRFDGGLPAWRSFTTSVDRILSSEPVRDMRALPGGRIALATGAGVMIVQPGRTMEDSIRMLTNYGEADGLPSSSIASLGDIDRNGRLWVNTFAGPGFVNLAAVDVEAAAPSAPLEVSLRTLDGVTLRAGSRISSSAGSLQLEASLASHHREEDSRYLIELDGEPMDPTGWSGSGRASLLALEAGRHVVRIRSSDWRGQQSVVASLPFEILPPWWRSGGALVAYLAVVIGLWFAADRIRHRILTERAREAEASERRIAASEARFRRLFEDGGDPQVLVLKGAVWRANAAAEALLSSPNGPPLVGTGRDALLPSIPAAADAAAVETDAFSTSGTPIPVELRRTVIPLDDATIDHLMLRDLRAERRREAERRSLETQLLQSQRLESLGTLAGGVAHDFNNVLTIIQANAEMAERDVPSGSDAGEALKHLLSASRRARDIVRQILTFSRRGSTARTPVRLATLVQGLTQMLRASFPPTVKLEVSDTAGEAWVLGDETQLQQMLLNLCTNAEYAMRARGGGVLTLSVTQVEGEAPGSLGEVSLRVSDTGVGIPASDLAHVFDPFFTTKPVGEGTGLGLSVLHGIVAAHGGRVTVESEVGKGTAFDVRLPRIVAPSRPAQDMARPAEPVRFASGLRVLVVDDEPAVAFVVERILQEQGFEVTVALSGKAALEQLGGEGRFDAVVTDQTMPGMRGDEVARAALAIDPGLRVLLMSGYSATVGPSQMAAAGIHGFVEKPFTRDQLLVAIRRVVGKSATPAA